MHDRAAAIEGNTALLRKLELLANVQKASPILKRISTFIFNRIQKNKAIRNSHLHAAFQDTPLMEILEKSATTNNGTLSEAFSSWQDSLSGDVFDEIITIALADNPILATLRIVARIQTLFATASDTNSNTVIVNQMLVLNPDLQGLDFTPSNGNLFDAFSVLENEVKKLGSGVTVDHSHANTGQLNLLNTAPTIERVIIFYKKISQNEDIKNNGKNKLGFPGGMIEKEDESLQFSALRELLEESQVLFKEENNISVKTIRQLLPYTFPLMKKQTNFILIPNMISSDFLSLMSCADVMVGNSSAAIREAPSYKLPAVNIGSRQQGRLRANNIIDVKHERGEIINAINTALYDNDFHSKLKNIKNPYGDGKSAKRIINILQSIDLNPQIIQKRISYE